MFLSKRNRQGFSSLTSPLTPSSPLSSQSPISARASHTRDPMSPCHFSPLMTSSHCLQFNGIVTNLASPLACLFFQLWLRYNLNSKPLVLAGHLFLHLLQSGI